VTTFRSSKIIVIDASGQIVETVAPGADGISTPSVAWRAVGTPTGEVVVAHQVADTNLGVGTGESAYGMGSGPCTSSIVTPALTSVSLAESASTTRVTTSRVSGAGPTDIAVASNGRFAFVIAGNAWSESPSVVSMNSPEEGSICPEPPLMPGDVGEPVAVAFDGSGQAVVQSREPAALYLEFGGKIELSSESHANTGLALFHMDTGGGIACASCHPEGTDDSQTWFFSDIGYRRTQMLAGGIRDRAPFHWNGDMEDFDMLIDEVMVGRMSLAARPNPAQAEAFLGWVDSVERPIAVVGDAAAIERGKELFFDPAVGCDECHTGRALTNKRLFDVGTGGRFVVPSLIGIATRAPYLHDGSAKTLHARFSVGGGGDQHGKTSHLSEEQVDDLVTYLETL
jgi:mono/diheme cytochrome c family protein